MRIVKERTRLIFTDYSALEMRKIEDMVGTSEKVFLYEDPDGRMISLPAGMEEITKKIFPQIRIEDHSSLYWDYAAITPVEHNAQPRNQLQIDFIQFVLEQANKKKKLAGILSPGTGKALPVSTKIPAPVHQGYILMGDIKPGDKVFGSDGGQVVVLDEYDQGERDIYKVSFDDGRESLCDIDHLWNVYINDNIIEQTTISTRQMLEDFQSNRYMIPMLSSPVKYPHQDIPVHPYVIGAFLCNDCSTESYVRIRSDDTYVPNEIADMYGYTTKCHDPNVYTFYHSNKRPVKPKEFFKWLTYSNVDDVVKIYMYNSVSVRMSFLHGLMDTNGSVLYNDGSYDIIFTHKSDYFLNVVRQLILGMGYKVTLSYDNYTVQIHMPQDFKYRMFAHPEKGDIPTEPSDEESFKYLTITNIEYSHKEHAKCIRVDAPDSLYLTEDFIVTHNTFMACYSAIKVGLRTLIIVPTSNIKDQWGATLTDMFNVDPSKVKLVKSPKDFINVKEDFVVVSQASLAVLNKTYDLEKVMKANKFGIKVIDEVQMWFHNIIKVDGNSNICHNWYLTGTFGRSGEEENSLYQQMFGDLAIFKERDKKPTIFNRKPGNVYGMKPHMHVKMMWTHSGLSKEQIYKVSNSIRYSERSQRWMRYGLSIPAYTELVIPQDGTMTPFLKNVLKIVKMANEQVKYGKMLILSPTIASVLVIQDYVSKMYPNLKVGSIHSRNNKAENDRVKAECDILISTVKSSGTGFDVKDLSKLVVAEQFKSWILADQVSGRLRRRPDGKDTYMWDIVDADVRQLRAWANARADVLRRKSKTFKVVDM